MWQQSSFLCGWSTLTYTSGKWTYRCWSFESLDKQFPCYYSSCFSSWFLIFCCTEKGIFGNKPFKIADGTLTIHLTRQFALQQTLEIRSTYCDSSEPCVLTTRLTYATPVTCNTLCGYHVGHYGSYLMCSWLKKRRNIHSLEHSGHHDEQHMQWHVNLATAKILLQ